MLMAYVENDWHMYDNGNNFMGYIGVHVQTIERQLLTIKPGTGFIYQSLYSWTHFPCLTYVLARLRYVCQSRHRPGWVWII